MRSWAYAVLLPMMLAPQFAAAVVCGATSPAPLPVRSTPVPPLATGLAGRPVPYVTPQPLLADSRDEALALDLVLLRLKLETCTKDAFAGYKPRTQFDNTPWRFNMDKSKKFNAAEFDAWMRSRGVRVAKGTAPAAAAATATAALAPTTPASAPAAAPASAPIPAAAPPPADQALPMAPADHD